MKYFNGVNFISCGEDPRHNAVQKDRFFDGYYGIQYNHAGIMDFSIGSNPLRKVEGAFAFISLPGLKFYYGAPSGKIRHHVYVCFKGPRIDRFVMGGLLELNRRQPLIRIANSERFIRTFRELIANISHNPPQNYNRAVLLLEDLLLQMHDRPTEKTEISSHLVPGLKQLETALIQNPQLEWDFFKESSSLGVSYPHFRRIFRQYTGTSPVNFLIKSRLQKAARLLLNSSEQICRISEKCGMADEFYFSRIFKKYYNLPPKNYRREFKIQP